jgi:hypothetical protein
MFPTGGLIKSHIGSRSQYVDYQIPHWLTFPICGLSNPTMLSFPIWWTIQSHIPRVPNRWPYQILQCSHSQEVSYFKSQIVHVPKRLSFKSHCALIPNRWTYQIQHWLTLPPLGVCMNHTSLTFPLRWRNWTLFMLPIAGPSKPKALTFPIGGLANPNFVHVPNGWTYQIPHFSIPNCSRSQ